MPDRLHAVGPGWHALLLRLHEQLLILEPGYRVDDLKEKFGTVRVYLASDSVSSRLDTQVLLAAAEAQSATTCEFCGTPGRRRGRGDKPGGWIKTVCDSCHTAWSRRTIMIIHGVVHRREPGLA